MFGNILYIMIISSLLAESYQVKNASVAREIINDLIDKRYKKELRPYDGTAEAVDVAVNLLIQSISNVDSTNMEFHMTILLRHKWIDPRLKYTQYSDYITIDPDIRAKIWVPDTFFSNEKEAKRHEETKPNVLLRLYPDGAVYYSMRLTLILSCSMDLRNFPLDTQHCFIKAESYAFTTDEVAMKWFDGGVEHETYALRLPQFEVRRIRIGHCSKNYSSGQYPCLVSEISFKRQFGYYIIQMYIPSALVVVLSFLTFWIDISAVPARVTLGITSVLTLGTQMSSARASLPHVSYIKAVDVWMSACMVFAMLALIEFTVANYFFRRERDKQTIAPDDNRKLKNGGATDKDTSDAKVSCVEDARARHQQPRRLPKLLQKNKIADWIDFVSRIVFYVVFVVFVAIYWVYYLYIVREAEPHKAYTNIRIAMES